MKYIQLIKKNKALLLSLIIFFNSCFITKIYAVPELYNDQSRQNFESINLYNGHLNYTVPLGKLGARGKVTFDNSISISNTWQSNWSNYTDNTGGNNNFSYVFPPFITHNHNASLGYFVRDGKGGGTQSCNPQNPNASNVDYSRTHTRIIFYAGNGSKITFKDTLNNGAILTRTPCTTYRPARGTVFVGEEDPGITFISDDPIFDIRQDVTNPPPPDPPLTGTMYLKDGTKYRYENGTTKIIDRNGNILERGPPTVGQSVYVDNAGREIRFDPYGDIFDASTVGFEVISKGVNGQSRIIDVKKNYLHNKIRSDYTQSAQYCTAVLFPQIGCLSVYDELYDPYIISSIILPDNRSFEFYYNHYGELARVEYPAGGAVEYDYTQLTDLYLTGIVHRAVTEKRVYPNGGTGASYESKTNYSYDYSDHTETTVITTDQSGNFVSKTKHYLFGEPYGDLSPNGRYGGNVFYPYEYGLETKEYKTEYYGSLTTVLKTIEYDWRQANGSNSTTAILNAPRVVQKKTTLNDSGQVSKINYEYDQYLNLTDTIEYDYNSNQIGRHTHTDYISDADYTSYTASHLRDLPSQSWISTDLSGSNKKSLTVYEYDNYVADSQHAPLENRVDVFGHDSSNYGSSFTKRGNITKATSFVDAQTQTDPISSFIQYDILGNVIKSIDPKGNISTIDYTDRFGTPDGEARQNSSPTELGSLSTFAFPTSSTNPKGWTTGYTQYDFYTGQIVDNENINGVVNSTFYNDALDRPTKNISANNISNFRRSTTILYDDLEKKVTTYADLNFFNDNKLKSVNYYDGLGRTIENRKYESDGGYIAVKSVPFTVAIDPETSHWKSATMSTNPYRPNSGEQPVWTTSLNDSLGRNIKMITPDGDFVKKDYSGNIVTITDQAGKQRRAITNALGQLTRVDEPNGVGLGSISTPNQPTNYTYDVLDNLLTVSQIGTSLEQCGSTTTNCIQIRSFSYDSLSRLKQSINPESGTEMYSYDSNGNLTSKIDANNITTNFVHDNLNRLTQRTYSDSLTPTVNYVYDDKPNSKGLLTKITNGISTTEYQIFDELGRVIQSYQTTDELDLDPNKYKPMTYTYNLSGVMIEQTYPSGRIVKNVIDNDGTSALIQSKKNTNSGVWNYAKSITYDATGAVKSMQLGNGKWESTQFNSRLQPTQIALGTIKNGTDKLKLDFEYGNLNLSTGQTVAGTNNGNVSKQIITVQDAGLVVGFTATQYYAYDELNRLSIATENIQTVGQPLQLGWRQQFKYDRYGNKSFDEENTTTLTKLCGTTPNLTVCTNDRKRENPAIDPANNRIKELQPDGDSIKDYKFDTAGNTFEDINGRRYTYDGENKQTKVQTLDVNGNVTGTIGEYFYDGDGKRVKKVVPNTGETTIFIYDASGKMVAEYSTNVETTNAKVSYLTSDHLGSPRITTDADGDVYTRRDFMPFGEEIDVNDTSQRTATLNYASDEIRQKFTSYERDNETELEYAQTRMYNNQYGRFTTTDPLLTSSRIETPQTWNKYAYVLGNPLNSTDPLGLYCYSEALGGCAKDAALRSVAGYTLSKEKRDEVEAIISQRDVIREALSFMRNAANSKDKGLSDVEKMEILATLNAFGEEYEDNVVELGFSSDFAKETSGASAGISYGLNGSVIILDSAISKDSTQLALALANEGSNLANWHSLLDGRVDMTQYEDESRSFNTEALVAQGLGLNSDPVSGSTELQIWNKGWAAEKREENRSQGIDRMLFKLYRSDINGEPLSKANPGSKLSDYFIKLNNQNKK